MKVFFEKPIYFSRKTPNFELIEKSYYFNCILQQVCYNLMKKKSWHSDTWTTDVGSFGANSIGKHRVKNASIWGEDFASHIFNMAQNKNQSNALTETFWRFSRSKFKSDNCLTHLTCCVICQYLIWGNIRSTWTSTGVLTRSRHKFMATL